MSTASLPSYTSPPQFFQTPSYAREPRAEERRLAQGLVYNRRAADFVKQNKSASIVLRLSDQVEGADIPTYGLGATVDGVVELTKTDGLAFVAIKVEGTMKLQEIAEGGTSTSVLCSETITLWRKGVDSSPCPDTLGFSVSLPTEYSEEKETFPLPPSFEAHLSGLPGFHADVRYSVTAVASKTKLALGKPNSLRSLGQSVSTPLIYSLRTCPSSPLPPPLEESSSGIPESPDWKAYESTVNVRSQGARPIQMRFYIPKSQVFCRTEPIPFHVSFASSAVTLASLLPYLPSGDMSPAQATTRIQLLRQICVNVKDEYVVKGNNTELWKVINIGEGIMRQSASGPRKLSFSGEIKVSSSVKVDAFKAGGLWIKDFIVFHLNPPEALKGIVGDARIVIPVRLVSNLFASNANASVFVNTPPARVSPPESLALEETTSSLSFASLDGAAAERTG